MLDHPLLALCKVARLWAHGGRPLATGSLVLAGSAIDSFGSASGQKLHRRIDGPASIGFAASGVCLPAAALRCASAWQERDRPLA